MNICENKVCNVILIYYAKDSVSPGHFSFLILEFAKKLELVIDFWEETQMFSEISSHVYSCAQDAIFAQCKPHFLFLFTFGSFKCEKNKTSLPCSGQLALSFNFSPQWGREIKTSLRLLCTFGGVTKEKIMTF